MSEYVMQTHRLSKTYNNHVALDQVDLSVPKGSIYGFIGQNGAGKSTLMRIAAGLAYPTSGSLELLGESGEAGIVRARAQIGVAIESPALFPYMTAYENMEVQRRQKGIRDPKAIEPILEIVGLQGTGKKVAGAFSLGMKQRLDLALALLGSPEFLILDEPTNGLDPMSVVELRELLKGLNQDNGMTILISSHILSELHLLATHYGIIHQGRLLEQLTAQQLNDKCRQYLHIKVNDPLRAAEVLARELDITEFEVRPDGEIRIFRDVSQPGRFSSVLAASGLILEQLMPMGEPLESYFVRRIGGGA